MASVFVHTTMKGTPMFFSSRPRGSTVTCLLSIVLSAAESSSADVLCESHRKTNDNLHKGENTLGEVGFHLLFGFRIPLRQRVHDFDNHIDPLGVNRSNGENLVNLREKKGCFSEVHRNHENNLRGMRFQGSSRNQDNPLGESDIDNPQRTPLSPCTLGSLPSSLQVNNGHEHHPHSYSSDLDSRLSCTCSS